jgi:putative peptide zinc metalloprotease protein
MFHPHWYRIADLHPRLRGHVTIRRQVVRDQVWYVLSDPADGRHFRLNPTAYRFVGLCDGERSVHAVWEHMTETLGDEAPTQGDLVGILGRLSEGGLLQTEALPDVDVMFENRSVRRDKQRWSQLNPMFFRVALIDPSPYLLRFDPWLKRLFSPLALSIWLFTVLLAALFAAMNGPALASHAAERMASPVFLLLTWLAYPLVKALHELGHALAIRRWGGKVTKVGVTLLLLMPIPWVDASASSTFRFRIHRLVVSATGIMVEVFLAALAMLFWLAVEPGLMRDAALAVMLIAGVSTVLFNGNPLMRYDGYFILSDAIDLPNLAPRSANYWSYLGKRHLLGQSPEPPLLARGERAWLLFYSPASLVYRVVISVAIAVWLSGISALLAAVAGAILVWTFFVKPGIWLVNSIWAEADGSRRTRRARTVASTTALVLAGVLFILPLPLRIVADGVVWLPENARVRPETEGFVVRILADDGARVTAGQPLLELQDNELYAERDRLYAQLAKFQNEQYGVFMREPTRARNLAEEVDSLQEALKLNETRLQNLTVRAGSAGRLVIPHQEDLPGRFVSRGAEVGYILDDAAPRVRAVLSQQDVGLVRERLRGAEVWLCESATSYPSRPDRDIPSATVRLPSPALGDRGGGGIVTDAKDEKGLTATEPVFLAEVELPAERLERVGARANVRFDLGYEPIAQQAWRRLRQMFLSQFSQTG